MPNDDSSRALQRDIICWLLVTGGLTFAYAILRYNVFKGVEWIHLPLYITNKAVSWSAVILIAASYLVNKRREGPRHAMLAKLLGLSGFSLATTHVVMSLLMHSPHYYPKLFGEEKLNLTGELSMGFGVFSLTYLTVPVVTSLPQIKDSLDSCQWRRYQRMGYLALACVAAHLFVMGFADWITPAAWPGNMPPITLLGFLAAIMPLVVRLARGRRTETN